MEEVSRGSRRLEAAAYRLNNPRLGKGRDLTKEGLIIKITLLKRSGGNGASFPRGTDQGHLDPQEERLDAHELVAEGVLGETPDHRGHEQAGQGEMERGVRGIRRLNVENGPKIRHQPEEKNRQTHQTVLRRYLYEIVVEVPDVRFPGFHTPVVRIDLLHVAVADAEDRIVPDDPQARPPNVGAFHVRGPLEPFVLFQDVE
jgi:hypothetical protein